MMKLKVFYLYILVSPPDHYSSLISEVLGLQNRALLVAYQFWNFYYYIIITPDATVLQSEGVFYM